MKKRLTLLLMALMTLSVFASQSPRRAGTVTDELTWEGLGLDATSNNYVDFQDKSFTSQALYSGNAASNRGQYIQLRSNYSNSGIVTTRSGGNIKSITIIWNSGTTAERTLSIYGKNEAYTDATDLYSDSKGDLLGELSYTTESKTLNVQGTYTHIGLRSKTGAQYIDKIIIEWESEAEGISIIHNGNLEGEDASSFKAKEYGVNQANGVDVNTILNATIVDGAGVNGSRGIVVQAAPLVSESWDTQFFIVFDEPLFEQTTLSIKFDYKASSEATVDVQAHYGPGEYNYYDIGCGMTFKEVWQTFEKTITVEPSWTMASGDGVVRGFKTIAFNLAKENAMTYYFDNFEITANIVNLAAPKWINTHLNGNCEGEVETGYIGKMSNWGYGGITERDLYSFCSVDKINGEGVNIVDGVGVNGSRCAVVESVSNASEAWDTQFFITSPHQFKPGQRFYLKFDYKADDNTKVSTQQHGLPQGYIFWEGIGEINFTTEWQTFEKQFTVSESWCSVDQDGTIVADWNSGAFFQTIAFNLNEDKNLATKFYFDNIEWSLDDGESGYATDEERKLAEIVQNQIQNGGATETWTVAGEPAALFGTEWEPSLVANNMIFENGIYTWGKNNVELTGDVQFKVVKNHSWDNEAYPYSNYVLTIPRAGNYNVLISFNPETKEINATATDKRRLVSNIAELNNLEDQVSFNFTGEALIVAKPTDKFVYIKDNSGSSLIYDESGIKTAAAKIGKTIAANWAGKVNVHHGLFEVVPDGDIIVTDGNATAITYEEAELNGITEDNINKVVVLKNVTYVSDGKDLIIYKGGTNVKGYNKFDISYESPEEGATYNVIGAISYYDNQIEFLPISVKKAAEQQYSVSFVNIKSWNKVCAYAWTWDNEENAPIVFTGDWPGTEIAKTGEKTVDGVVYDIYTLYLYTEDMPDFVIFNNGNWGDGNQTADLPFINGKEYDSLSPPVEIVLGISGCATLSSEYMLSFAGITNVKAYRASEVINNVAIMTPLENKVEANTGIFLIGEPYAQISIPTTFGGGDSGNNLLRPSVSQTVVEPSTEGSYRYTFKDINGQEGFYLINGGGEICPARKAYLETSVPLSVDDSGLARWMTEEDYLKYGTGGGTFKILSGVGYQFGEEITSVEGIKMTFGQKLPEGQERTGQYADFNAGKANNAVDGFTAYTAGNNANPKDDNIEGYLPALGNLPTNGTFYTFEPEKDGALTIGIVLNTGKPFYILEDGEPIPEFRAVYISKEYGEKYYGIAALNVKGGKKYHMFATGSKLGFYGYTYQPGRTTDIIGPEGTRDLLFSSLSYTLPEADILYDGEPHAAVVEDGVGRGTLHIIYIDDNGNESETAPVNPGNYTVSFDFEEGNVFNAIRFDNVGTFGIYQADEQELNILASAYQSMGQGEGWKKTWDFSKGIVGAKNLYGVTFTKGFVTEIDLSNNNLTGAFPTELLALSNLKSLNLSKNKLSGNLDEATTSFVEAHSGLAIAIKSMNISNNLLAGNIGAFASYLPRLESLNISDNKFDALSPMIAPNVNLTIGQQVIDREVSLHLKDLKAETIAEKAPSILLYCHAQQDYDASLQLLLSKDDWSANYSCYNNTLRLLNVSSQNAYKGNSGEVLSMKVSNDEGANSTLQLKLEFDEGDSNFNGSVNILDLQATIDFMFEEYINKPFNFTAANLWTDDKINVQDAVSLVNLLLEDDGTKGARRYALRTPPASSDNGYEAYAYIQDGQLMINSTLPISAFDIIINSNEDIEMSTSMISNGITCSVKKSGNKTHIIGYSLSGGSLPVGENVICNLTDGTISYIMLADKDANEIRVSINSESTGMSTMKNNNGIDEKYRIPIGAQRAIVIESTGRKSMVKGNNTK